MHNSSLAVRAKTRSPFALILLSLMVLASMTGCKSLFGVSRTVGVPPLLTPLAQANTSQLIDEVNRVAGVRSIRGKVDIQFQDTSFAEAGLAEKYRTADGTLFLQRPAQIYLKIQAPFVGTNIAEMTSDGEHFRVAVLQGDDKYRRFVRGTNNATYPTLAVDDANAGRNANAKTMSEQRARSVLSNLRPQHLTDALLMRPILPRADSGLVYAQSEFYQEETNTSKQERGRATGGEGRVVRGYYLLDELAAGGATGAHLLRRFWFDRVGSSVKLARLQTFDGAGALITDVTYTEPKNFGEGGSVLMPSRIEITRPQDRYKLSVSYQSPESVVIDREYPSDVFTLENKWQLPELDLDAKRQ
ncbi:MAG TPA: hypothetical protein VE842_19740 [Pyrinomonadaceae bacterium]|jgi:hypothetical protein|nr:hypothetical protein [Pyrinomonadaceae bacterium]